MAAPDPDPRMVPLLDLWRARLSFVYWFERMRLRSGRGRRFFRKGLILVVVILVMSVVGLVHGSLLIEEVIALVGILVVPVALVVGSIWAGLRVLGDERADATLDALVMTPIPRRELVSARLLTRMRPLFLILGLIMICLMWVPFLFFWPADSLEQVLAYCAILTVVCFTYLSIMMLAAGLGLYFGLRIRSTVGAFVASLAMLSCICVLEFSGSVFVLKRFGTSGIPALYWLWVAPPVMGVANLGLADSFLNTSARNFDKWATRD